VVWQGRRGDPLPYADLGNTLFKTLPEDLNA
jgi:hypothetical protein